MASPELQTLIDMMRAAPPRAEASVEERRDGFDQLGAMIPQLPDARIEALRVNGTPAEWSAIDGSTPLTTSGASPSTTVLFLHGGGYVIGSLNSHRRLVSDIARAADARVLAIDYRMGPEHPHPAAVDDAVDAYRWLLAQGVAPERIAIAGDSAGGGLTAATLLALRDAGGPLPACAVMMSPWLDLACAGDSMTTKAPVDPMISPTELHGWASMYHGAGDLKAPLASPLYAELSGLPPIMLQVGTEEILLDDSLRYAERAKAAGADVTLDVWDEMIHVWQLFAFMLPEAQQAIDRAGAFIKERVAVHA
jgi:monoterpene epsilon-lactone hydrolase